MSATSSVIEEGRLVNWRRAARGTREQRRGGKQSRAAAKWTVCLNPHGASQRVQCIRNCGVVAAKYNISGTSGRLKTQLLWENIKYTRGMNCHRFVGKWRFWRLFHRKDRILLDPCLAQWIRSLLCLFIIHSCLYLIVQFRSFSPLLFSFNPLCDFSCRFPSSSSFSLLSPPIHHQLPHQILRLTTPHFWVPISPFIHLSSLTFPSSSYSHLYPPPLV